jgi:hypothetical protein
MKLRFLLILVAVLSVVGAQASGQTHYLGGGNMGLSVGSAAGQSSAGFHFGPMFEVVFQKNLAVGTELNINTQDGTPVEWGDYFKYYFSIPGSKVRPYVDGGFSLWFVTGGPYFGLRFGGGANIPVGRNLYVSPDMQLGPIFATGTTVFYFTMRGGLRYEF